MEGLVQQLFSFLGGLLTTCSSDAPLLRGGLRPGPAPPLRHPRPQASPAAPPSCLADPVARRRARPQASLTATHSSTLAEETVALLRALHRLGQWRGLVSAHINARLRAAARGCGGHACGVRAAVLSHAAGCPGARTARGDDHACQPPGARLQPGLCVLGPVGRRPAGLRGPGRGRPHGGPGGHRRHRRPPAPGGPGHTRRVRGRDRDAHHPEGQNHRAVRRHAHVSCLPVESAETGRWPWAGAGACGTRLRWDGPQRQRWSDAPQAAPASRALASLSTAVPVPRVPVVHPQKT